MVAAAVAATALGFSAFASAATFGTVTYDLREHGTGAKTIDVTHAGQTVILDLYASVQGLDLNPNNDIIGAGSGTFKSATGGLLGNLLGLGSPAPYNAIGSELGSTVDFDSDGDLDVWSAQTTSIGYYYFRAQPPYTLPQSAEGSLVGRVQFTVSDFSLAETTITWTQRTPINSMTAYVDDLARSRTQVNVAYGEPLTIRGVSIAPPPGVVYRQGNIAAHTSVTQNTWVTPGQWLTFSTGVDVQPGGALEAAGRPLQIYANDATSGNFGGAISGAELSVGPTGIFTNAAGNSAFTYARVDGTSPAVSGMLAVTGGQFQTNALSVGSTTAGGGGRYAQTGGAAQLTTLTIRNGSAAVSGGALHVIGVTEIGRDATGTFTQAGGVTTLGGATWVGGTSSAGNGVLRVENGTLNAGRVAVGYMQSRGVIEVAGGIMRAGSIELHSSLNGPALSVTDGSLEMSSLVFIDPALARQTGGTVNMGQRGGTFIPNRAGEFQYSISNGSFNAASLTVQKTNTAPVAVSGHRGGFVQSGGAVVNLGLITLNSASTYGALGGTLNLTGTLKMSAGSIIDFGGGAAQLNVGANAFANFSSTLLDAQNASFTGAPGSLMSFTSQAQFDSVGSVTSNGLVHIAGQPLTVPQNSSIGGSGTIEGNLTNNGTIAPGNSPGVLEVNGNFTQASSGALLMELAGTGAESFDLLNVSGSAAIDGMLNVSLLGDYLPNSSNSFTILTASSLTGTFDNVIGGEVSFSGGTFDVIYSPNSVTLTGFTPVPEPGSVALLTLGAIAMTARRRRMTVA